MSKEIIHHWLLIGFCVCYALVFLVCCFSAYYEQKESDRINSAGCAAIMVIVPVVIACVLWYINLPDKVLR